MRIALLVARFNSLVTEELCEGARNRLRERGLVDESVVSLHVPGAWDLPQAARRIAGSGQYDAIVAIGCVIRGETAHFDYVAGNASDGLGRVALDCGVPVVFGVLATDTAEQARARSDLCGSNRGAEFADAALELLELFGSHPADGGPD